MSKYREQYLESLTTAVGEILKKSDFTENDLSILFLYKQELSRYEYTPLLKKVAKFAKEVTKILNKGDDKENE